IQHISKNPHSTISLARLKRGIQSRAVSSSESRWRYNGVSLEQRLDVQRPVRNRATRISVWRPPFQRRITIASLDASSRSITTSWTRIRVSRCLVRVSVLGAFHALGKNMSQGHQSHPIDVRREVASVSRRLIGSVATLQECFDKLGRYGPRTLAGLFKWRQF